MIRKAGFRGLWYPFTAEECRAYVGDIKRDGEIINGVLPHAGWPYSASMIKEYFSGLSEDVKRIIIEQGIPFEVSARVPNAVTAKAMDEFDEMKRNPAAYKKYADFKEAAAEVLKDA